jgi:hypothetical protein
MRKRKTEAEFEAVKMIARVFERGRHVVSRRVDSPRAQGTTSRVDMRGFVGPIGYISVEGGGRRGQAATKEAVPNRAEVCHKPAHIGIIS